MITEIIADLTSELSVVDDRFNADLLAVKVNNAYREIKKARSYPIDYTAEQIEKDMDRFYTNVRNLALYDYNSIGAEFQSSSEESSESRQWVDRRTMFSGVIPIANL